jgi:hypothetical protein
MRGFLGDIKMVGPLPQKQTAALRDLLEKGLKFTSTYYLDVP